MAMAMMTMMWHTMKGLNPGSSQMLPMHFFLSFVCWRKRDGTVISRLQLLIWHAIDGDDGMPFQGWTVLETIASLSSSSVWSPQVVVVDEEGVKFLIFLTSLSEMGGSIVRPSWTSWKGLCFMQTTVWGNRKSRKLHAERKKDIQSDKCLSAFVPPRGAEGDRDAIRKGRYQFSEHYSMPYFVALHPVGRDGTVPICFSPGWFGSVFGNCYSIEDRYLCRRGPTARVFGDIVGGWRSDWVRFNTFYSHMSADVCSR